MSKDSWHIHFAGDQKVKWALDEDLKWARAALGEHARLTSLPQARIVHAAWWPALEAIGQGALAGKTVLCFADNPPALYLSQPGFAEAAKYVDRWIARSREALAQFQSLDLPAVRAPYCVDPEIFKALPDFRRESDGHFVIGNFHRDTEGANLAKPKAQKGPDIFLEIATVLHRRVPQTLVLLAGPRRHWLRANLAERGVPFRFVGEVREGDDFETNILDRPTLNRLYHELDVCVVSSRWEGGPYSVLESLFAGRPVISTPVGIARDALPPECLYRSVEEAVTLLENHFHKRSLAAPAEEARRIARRENSLERLRECLLAVYEPLPRGGASLAGAARSGWHMVKHRLARPASADAHPLEEAAPSLLPAETPFTADRAALLRSAAAIARSRVE